MHNASAQRELNVLLNGQRLRHDPCPVYLGVTLDRSLTYRDHLTKVAGKVKTRNNLLGKLEGLRGEPMLVHCVQLRSRSRTLPPNTALLSGHVPRIQALSILSSIRRSEQYREQ